MNDHVEIDHKRYPSVALICPLHEQEQEPCSDWDRSLGTGGDPCHYVPAENGVIFCVDMVDPSRLELALYCVVCEEDRQGDETLWLPVPVSLGTDGSLRVGRGGINVWWGCEPDWVRETIDRLSRRPFTLPDGPRARMVPRDAVLEGART